MAKKAKNASLSQANKIERRLKAEGKITDKTTYTQRKAMVAEEKSKMKRGKFSNAELIAAAPKGMSRVVEYSTPKGVRGDRYKYEAAELYLKNHFEKIEDKYRAGQAVMNRNALAPMDKRVLEGLVLYQMVQLGMSRKNILDYMEENWNVDRLAAATMVSYVLTQLADTDEKDRERGKAVYCERLENLYATCVGRGDVANALKVMEQMGRIKGYFNDTTVVAPVMNFKFGNEPSTVVIPSEAAEPAEEVKEIPEELKEEFNWS